MCLKMPNTPQQSHWAKIINNQLLHSAIPYFQTNSDLYTPFLMQLCKLIHKHRSKKNTTLHICKYVYNYIYIYIWVNYNISLTFHSSAIKGADFPSQGRPWFQGERVEQWGPPRTTEGTGPDGDGFCLYPKTMDVCCVANIHVIYYK